MFTGLIEEMGTVRSIRKEGGGVRLEIAAAVVIEKAQIGDSIAVNGVCLTVTALGNGTFCADVMNETVTHSTLADLNRCGSCGVKPLYREKGADYRRRSQSDGDR